MDKRITDMKIYEFTSFCLQLHNLVNLRIDKNQHCICCMNYGEHEYVREQINILIKNYIGIDRNEIILGGTHLKLITNKAKEALPELNENQLSDLIRSLIYQ